MNASTRKAFKERSMLFQKGMCLSCGCTMQPNDGGTDFSATLEHVLPKSCGGGNGMYNIVLTCKRCNENMVMHYRLLTDTTYRELIRKFIIKRTVLYYDWRIDIEIKRAQTLINKIQI